MPNNRIILHIDMDYFFAQCEEREHPELKGKPVVICVYSGRSADSGAVSTSNYEARKSGVLIIVIKSAEVTQKRYFRCKAPQLGFQPTLPVLLATLLPVFYQSVQQGASLMRPQHP